jgi:Cation transporter/ATPase, N-terminus
VTSRAEAVAPSSGIDLATAATAMPQEVLKRLGSSDSGLSATEAAGRLGRYGPNIVGLHRVRALAVLWGQLRNPLLLLLLVAAGVSGLTGDPTDAIIIAVIVALSVGLGFVNEYRAAVTSVGQEEPGGPRPRDRLCPTAARGRVPGRPRGRGGRRGRVPRGGGSSGRSPAGLYANAGIRRR